MATFLGYICAIGLFSLLVWGVTCFYVKIIQKKSLSNRHKKIGLISLSSVLIPVLIVLAVDKIQHSPTSGTSTAESESEYTNSDSNYKLHEVTNLKTSYDSKHEGDQVITGDTTAPDGSVVLISSEDMKESNSASDSKGDFVKVKDGHFKAFVGYVSFYNGEEMKKGQKADINVVAVEKYDRSSSQAIDYMLGENQLENLQSTQITLSDEFVEYHNSLNDDDESSSTEEAKPAPKPQDKKEESSNVESYSTDITYEQLARTPDDYKGKKVSMTGKVVQVMENSDITQLRVAINGNYDDIVLLEINKSDLDKSRILDDDLITFYGTSADVYTYKATLGQEITVPAILADKIDNQGKAPNDYGFDY